MLIAEIFDFFIEIVASITLFIYQFLNLIKFLFTSLPFTLLSFFDSLPTVFSSGIRLLIGVVVVVSVLKLIALVRAK